MNWASTIYLSWGAPSGLMAAGWRAKDLFDNVGAGSDSKRWHLAMIQREKFQIELLKLIISFHDGHLLGSDEMVKILKKLVTDAEEARRAVTGGGDDWFDEWMERQAL